MTIRTVTQRKPKPPPTGWQEKAACGTTPITIDYDPFFLFDGERITGKKWDDAKRICGTCPVKRECLQDAIATEMNVTLNIEGYRAGMTARARRDLINKIKAPR